MVFHGLTTLKKTPNHWKPQASSSSGGRQHPEDTLLLCAKDHWAKEGAHKLLGSVFLPVHSCSISLIHPTAEEFAFHNVHKFSQCYLEAAALCSLKKEQHWSLATIQDCPRNRQVIQRKRLCFQVSTHGNKQAKWREKTEFYFFSRQ